MESSALHELIMRCAAGPLLPEDVTRLKAESLEHFLEGFSTHVLYEFVHKKISFEMGYHAMVELHALASAHGGLSASQMETLHIFTKCDSCFNPEGTADSEGCDSGAPQAAGDQG